MYLQYGKLYKLTKNNLDTLQKSVIITKKSLTISKGFAIVNLLGSRGEFIKNGGGGLLFFYVRLQCQSQESGGHRKEKPLGQ